MLAHSRCVTVPEREQFGVANGGEVADVAGTRRAPVLAVAWIATLLISRLPEVVLREGLRLETPWMSWTLVLVSLLLWLTSSLVATLRPLRSYFLVMIAVTTMLAVIPVIVESAAWQALLPSSAGEMGTLLADRILLGILALVIIGLLLAIGTRPGDAYIRPGSINARSGVRLPGMSVPLRWTVVGPVWVVILAGLTGLAMLASLPAVIDLETAVPLLGVAVAAAAFNSFAEEVIYRAAPLSQLAPAIGAGHAALLLAVWFGLGHFYGGIPSGPVGAVMAGAVALLFGRAMIGTRGLAWPWALHFTIDLVIFSGIALAATGSAG